VAVHCFLGMCVCVFFFGSDIPSVCTKYCYAYERNVKGVFVCPLRFTLLCLGCVEDLGSGGLAQQRSQLRLRRLLLTSVD
jgi:hypothetical protein